MNESLFQQVNNHIESYADALERFDSKAMAQHYATPCSFLTDDSATMFDQVSKLEGFFNQGIAFYKQSGIVHFRPEVWSKHEWTGKIIKARVHWKYLDKDAQPVYNCDYQYVLRLDKANLWKIELSVSVNEKERMEAWRAGKK